MQNMIKITHNLTTLRARITKAAMAAEIDPECITIIAVSKLQPIDKIRSLYKLGLRDFGENYLQEAVDKQSKLPADIRWHFIGRVQGNKCKAIAQHFSWVHSVDRANVADKLNRHRTSPDKPLNVCIQVKSIDQPQKGGVLLKDLPALCEHITSLPNLKLRGFMTMPELSTNTLTQREAYRTIVALFRRYQPSYRLDTLSMGTSDDFEAAISMGSTMIRVGTVLFGERQQ